MRHTQDVGLARVAGSVRFDNGSLFATRPGNALGRVRLRLQSHSHNFKAFSKSEVIVGDRRALLEITPELIVRMLQKTEYISHVMEGLPLDTRVCGVGKNGEWFYAPDAAAVVIVLESEEFAEVAEGERIPHVKKPVVHRVGLCGEHGPTTA